jgi:hypothetical protein
MADSHNVARRVVCFHGFTLSLQPSKVLIEKAGRIIV